MKKINVLCVLMTVACSMIGNSEAQICNPYTGPNGATLCIQLPNYNGRQWATCRSDSYIRSVTGGLHRCEHSSARYCYYQCMLQKYHSTSGDVLGDCQCSSAESHKAKLYNLPFVCFFVLVTNYLFVL